MKELDNKAAKRSNVEEVYTEVVTLAAYFSKKQYIFARIELLRQYI